MKILILGARGNLGGQLVKVFEKDSEVIAWDRSEVDITDKDLITKKILEIKPDAIINAAAYNAVDKCEESEEEFEKAKKINGQAAGYLADAAISVGAILIRYSSDYVFDGENKNGYKEDDVPDNPVDKYGESQLAGEKEIISRSGKGLKWYLIRTSKLFGPKGESEAAKPSFFDIILKLSKEKSELNVVNEEVSCFAYTPDLAKATKEILASGKGYGIYHIVNGSPCTWYEAALELFKLANTNVKVNAVSSEQFPRLAKRPKFSVLLNTKLEPMRSYKEALKEYLNLNQEL